MICRVTLEEVAPLWDEGDMLWRAPPARGAGQRESTSMRRCFAPAVTGVEDTGPVAHAQTASPVCLTYQVSAAPAER